MNVAELMEKLKECSPDAEVHFCTDHDGFLSNTTEAEDVYASTATYGLALPTPKVVDIVVLDASMCGS